MAQIIDLRDNTENYVRNLQTIRNIFDSMGRAEAMRQERQRTTRILQALSTGGDVYEAALAEPEFDTGISGFFQRLGAGSAGRFQGDGIRQSVAERGIRTAMPTPYERALLAGRKATTERARIQQTNKDRDGYIESEGKLQGIIVRLEGLDPIDPEDVKEIQRLKKVKELLEDKMEGNLTRLGKSQIEAPLPPGTPSEELTDIATEAQGFLEPFGDIQTKSKSKWYERLGSGAAPPFGGPGRARLQAQPKKRKTEVAKTGLEVTEEIKGYVGKLDDESKAELQKILADGDPEEIRKAFEILRAKYGTI